MYRVVLAAAGTCLLLQSTVLAHPKPSDRPAFKTRVIAQGLHAPSGIVASFCDDVLYFTEVPTPGVAGPDGGTNAVKSFDLRRKKIKDISGLGEPEPIDIGIGADGVLYWTCRTAGVIVVRTPDGKVAPFLTGLDHPTGITADLFGNVFFTEVPTPGVKGTDGGLNSVNVDHGDAQRIIHAGDPAPTDIAVAFGGTTYWTCQSAGVIVCRDRLGNLKVILDGLDQPKGIALDRIRDKLYWTEVPTPGVAGPDGGTNEVWEYDLESGEKTLVDAGDPYPADVTVGCDGTVYWTCMSAGVIVEARRQRSRH